MALAAFRKHTNVRAQCKALLTSTTQLCLGKEIMLQLIPAFNSQLLKTENEFLPVWPMSHAFDLESN